VVAIRRFLTLSPCPQPAFAIPLFPRGRNQKSIFDAIEAAADNLQQPRSVIDTEPVATGNGSSLPTRAHRCDGGEMAIVKT